MSLRALRAPALVRARRHGLHAPGFRRAAARLLCVCGLVSVAAGAAAAEFAPAPPAPLAPDEVAGRAIVRFKPEASIVREQALAARSDATTARRALAQRAAALGLRRGITLAAGAAVDERTQVVLGSGLSGAALAQRLAADPDVEYAVPDGRRRRVEVPNDPLYLDGGAFGPEVGQWYLRPPEGEVVSAIDAQGAWDVTTGDPAVVVAVLDTGARDDHGELAGRLLPGYDMISDPVIANDGDGRDGDASDPGDWVTPDEAGRPPFDDCGPEASSWHGTRTAGLVGAATGNGQGVASVGRHARVQPVRVLGKCFGFDSDIVAGMRWAAGLPVPGVPANPTPARVLNLSLGGPGPCSAAYRDALSQVVAAGVVVVAAAGNSTGRAVGMPANCPGAIGVGAVRHVGTKVGFSDLGPEIAISAPGGNCVNLVGPCLYAILTLVNEGTRAPVPGSTTYAGTVGTSVAAPLVAGTAALMLSARPTLTPAQLRERMQATARPFPTPGAPAEGAEPVPACVAPGEFDQLQCYCTTSTCGAGLLDANAAVTAAAAMPAPAPAPVEPPDPGAVSEGGGGGAMGWGWLLTLVAAVIGLGGLHPARRTG